MKKRSMLVALAGAIVLASTVVLLVQTAGFHRVRLVGGNNLQMFPKEGLVVTFTGWDILPEFDGKGAVAARLSTSR